MKTVLCLSGGADSATLLYKLHREGAEVHPLCFDYGSKAAEAEKRVTTELCEQLGLTPRRVDLSFIAESFRSDLLKSGDALPLGHYNDESMARTVVPGRNSIFCSIAMGYAESIGADHIALANQAGDHFTYPDTRPEWFLAMGLLTWLGSGHKVRLHAPFTDLDKSEIITLGAKLKVPYQHTWSCYQSGEHHCGECGSCIARREGFATAGIPDPTSYGKN